MARITINDCLDHVDNHFELILLASKRARQLARDNIEPTVPWNDDEAPVVALREIAAGNVTKDTISLEQRQRKQADGIESVLLNSLNEFNF